MSVRRCDQHRSRRCYRGRTVPPVRSAHRPGSVHEPVLVPLSEVSTPASEQTARVNTVAEIEVMIIDDHEVVRRGIAEVIDRSEGLRVVAEAGSVAEAVRRMDLVKPEVMLVDLQLPDGTGIDIIEQASERLPETKCIVLTSFDDDDAVSSALTVGAKEIGRASCRDRGGTSERAGSWSEDCATQ